MPITVPFDTRESVPEGLKDHIVERDGKFVFEAEPLSEVEKTRSKYSKLSGDLDGLRKRLTRFSKLEELGDELDVDELLSLRDLKKQGKPLTADEKAELERLHKKALDKLSGDLKARDEKLSATEAQLKHFRLTVPLRDVAVKAGVIAEDLDLVMLDVAKRFTLNDAGKIVVLDEDGDETDITPQDFFGKLYKQQRPKFYVQSGAGGSGAQNNTSGGSGSSKTLTRAQFEQLSPVEKQAHFKGGGKVVD